MQEKFSQNDTFSYRLKVAIKASGLKQKEIAKKIGVSEITISRYCAGTQVPNSANIQELARVLGVPLSSLIDKSPLMSITPPSTPDIIPAYTSPTEEVEYWKNRAEQAEEKLQRIETILKELFAFARIGL